MNNTKYKTDLSIVPGRGTIDPMPPGAKLMQSLRSSGYTYWSAIDELIDNSIDAGASWVKMDFFDEDGATEKVTRNVYRLVVADNGRGMNHEALKNCHTLGSKRSYSFKDIGKFGLGASVGSISIARRWMTITREKDGEIFGRLTDLDEIIKRGNIVSIDFSKNEIDAEYLELFYSYLGADNSQSGTLMILENLDKASSIRADNMIRKLRTHTGSNFYSSLMKRDLLLTIDGVDVEHIHPILWDVEGTKQVVDTHIEVEVQKSEKELKKILLPLQLVDITDTVITDKNALKGQGGYFERCGRLIKGAVTNSPEMGVSGLWAHHAGYRDVRWLIKWDAEADQLFGVGFQKNNIYLQQALCDKIASIVNPHAKNIKQKREKSTKKPRIDANKEAVKKAKLKLNSSKSANIVWDVAFHRMGKLGEATEHAGSTIRLNEEHVLVNQLMRDNNSDRKTFGFTVLSAIEKCFVELGETEDDELIQRLHKSISRSLASIID